MARFRAQFADYARNNRDFFTPAIWDELERYVNHGAPPSNFIKQCLLDNLFAAANAADKVNGALLWYTAKGVYLFVPNEAKRSEENINRWISHQGLSGLSDEEEVSYR